MQVCVPSQSNRSHIIYIIATLSLIIVSTGVLWKQDATHYTFPMKHKDIKLFFKEYKHGNLIKKWAVVLFAGNLVRRDGVQGLFSANIAQKNVQLPLIKEKIPPCSHPC